MRKLRASFGSPKTSKRDSKRDSLSNMEVGGLEDSQEYGRYLGQVVNGKKNGVGKLIWSAGDWYEGEWVDDAKQGNGTMSWSNGDMYMGGWMDDHRHGENCTTKYNNGGVYEGAFVDDLRHGRGKFTWPDGDVYEGKWDQGGRSGAGVLIRYDGTREEQAWSESRANYSIALPPKRPEDLQSTKTTTPATPKDANPFFTDDDIDLSLLRSPAPHHNVNGPSKILPPRVSDIIIQPISSPPPSRSPRTSRRVGSVSNSPVVERRNSGTSPVKTLGGTVPMSYNPFLVELPTPKSGSTTNNLIDL